MQPRWKSILLFGAPGTGKGTQGKMLGTLPGFVHVASGDLFRAVDRGSELGRIFVEFSSKGLLVPDDFTVRLWKDHMARLIRGGRCNPQIDQLVLDGIPRNVAQAGMIDPFVEVVKLIVLRCDRDLESVVQRMRLRAEKEGRQDDANEATIRRRFEVYEQESEPVIDYYPAKVRVDIDALQTPVEVAHDILTAVLGRTADLRPVAPSTRAPRRK